MIRNWSDHLGRSQVKRAGVARKVLAALEAQVRQLSGAHSERLPSERALAQRLGVSRASVREALHELAARDLVVSKPGSGVYTVPSGALAWNPGWLVRSPTPDRAEMFEVRLMIESSAAEFAARRATPQDRADLESALRRIREAIGEGAVEDEADADARFHFAVVAAAHNTVLTRMYTSIDAALRTHIVHNTYEAHTDSEATDLSHQRLDQHVAIFQAISSRNALAARNAAGSHVDFVERQFNKA